MTSVSLGQPNSAHSDANLKILNAPWKLKNTYCSKLLFLQKKTIVKNWWTTMTCSSVPSLSFDILMSLGGLTFHTVKGLFKSEVWTFHWFCSWFLLDLEWFCLFPFCDKMKVVEFIQISFCIHPLVVNIPTSVEGKFLQSSLWVFTVLVLYTRVF